MAWRGLGGAGGAPRWRVSTLLSLRAGADAEHTQAVIAADAVATPDGLRVLLVTADSGDGSQRHLCVVTVEGDLTAVPPGVSAALKP